MKKLVLILALCITSLVSITYANFQSQVDVGEAVETRFQTLINTFFGNYISDKTPNIPFVNDMMVKRNAIVTLLNTQEVSENIYFALEYLVYVMDAVIDEIDESLRSGNTVLNVSLQQLSDGSVEVVISSIPKITPITNNPVIVTSTTSSNAGGSSIYSNVSIHTRDTDEDIILLGGEFSGPVSKFEITANLEPITIRDILIGSNQIGFAEAVDSIYVYDADGDLIASRNINDNFEELDLDITLPIGETDLYIALQTAEIGYGSAAPRNIDFALQMQILETVGENSGTRKTNYNTRTAENRISIQAIKINNVTLTDSHDGYQLPDVLLGSGIDQDLAYLTIYTAASENTQNNTNRSLDTQIHTIDISVQDNTSSQNSAQSLELVDSRTGEGVFGSLINNDTVRFNLRNNDLGYIDNGDDRTYILSITPDLDDNRNEAIRVYIDDINDGALTYSTTSELNTIYTTLDLDTYRLQGVTVSE